MAFETFADFIAMGRHGFYVWLSYGITSVILLLTILPPLFRRKQLLKELKQREKRAQKAA